MKKSFINNAKLKEKTMSLQDYFEQSLCRKCFIKHCRPTKKEIKKMVMSDEQYECDCCHKTDYVVEYLED